MPKKNKLDKQQILDMIRLRKKGLTNKEIARYYGIHTSAVLYWFRELRKRNYEIPPPIKKHGGTVSKLDL